MAGPRASTFDLSRVYEILGIRNPRTNLDVNEQLIQTVQVADVSSSFASEQFTARAAASAALGPIVAQTSRFELKAIAPGGIVVEAVFMWAERAAGTPAEQVFLNIEDPNPLLLGPAISVPLNVGGATVTSTLTRGHLAAASFPDVPIFLDPITAQRSIETLGWFVPSGQVLAMESDTQNAFFMRSEFQWREIPQSAGPQ